MKTQNYAKKTRLMLPLLAMLLPACAPNLIATGQACAPNPPVPATSTPKPSQSYSASAQSNISNWQMLLTDTPQM